MLTIGADYRLFSGSTTLQAIGGQFGGDGEPITGDIFLGVGADGPVGGDFRIGGPITVSIPFKGATEIFRAELSGFVEGRFGIEILWDFNPGTITATLPYDVEVAAPSAGSLVPGETYQIFTEATLDPDNGGFVTDFPDFLFEINAIMELAAQLVATYGAFGNNRTQTLFGFDASTVVPIFSVDTDRLEEDGGIVNVLGFSQQEVIDILDLGVTSIDGGIEIPFSSLIASGSGTVEVPVEKEGEKKPAKKEPRKIEIDVEGGASIDLGRIAVTIPDIEARDDGFNGTSYTTDQLTNKDDIVRLTLDLDGIATYMTGGTFPPLELAASGSASLGPVTVSAGFTYNLIDVELSAAVPLVQNFEVTPDAQTRLNFYDPLTYGSASQTTKFADVALNRKVVNFNSDGVFQSAAVETRLRELAAERTLFERDIDLFVDFDAGIPGAFTGETGSVGGALYSRPVSGGPFVQVPTLNEGGLPVAVSEPLLGEDQEQPVPVPTDVEFAYGITYGTPGAPTSYTTEFIPILFTDFADADTIWEKKVTQTIESVTSTGWLPDANAISLVYQDQVVVEVETRTTPTVQNQTGLGFTLDLILQGLAASASFGVSLDLKLLELSTGLTIGFDELFRKEFALLDFTSPDDLVDLFNESFEIGTNPEARAVAAAFTLGDPTDGQFAADVPGTEGNDPALIGDDTDNTIAGLGGNDVLRGLGGNDLLAPGTGNDTVVGGTGNDQVSYGDLAGEIAPATVTAEGFTVVSAGQRSGVNMTSSTAAALAGTWSDVLLGVETLEGSRHADLITVDVIRRNVLAGDGDDVIVVTNREATVMAEEGDDVIVDKAAILDGAIFDGGEGHDLYRRDGTQAFDLDLEAGPVAGGDTFISIEEFFGSDLGDRMAGDAEAQTFRGGLGDDELIGRAGRDLLYGGEGNDTINGGAGADLIDGGPGIDLLTYRDSPTSVFVKLDPATIPASVRIPNQDLIDGQAITGQGWRGWAQSDQIRNIENLEGTDFEDILFGSTGANEIYGGLGDDRIAGQPGNDTLFGGEGDDLLWMGQNLNFLGTAMQNTMDGGAGFDVVAYDYDENFITATVTGVARFSYLTGSTLSSETSSVNRTITFTVIAPYEPTLVAALDASGDGTAVLSADALAYSEVYVTKYTVLGRYSHATPRSIVDLFPPYRTVDVTITKTFSTAAPASAILESDVEPLTNFLFDSISIPFDSSLDRTNGSGSIRDLDGDDDDLDFTGRTQTTDTLVDVEGLIGTRGNDSLRGNDEDNAIFGNGAVDTVIGAGGDDRLGFGEGQSLTLVTSFPAGNGTLGNGTPLPALAPSLPSILAGIDPEADAAGVEAELNSSANTNRILPVGRIGGAASNAYDVGSFIWGGAGIDTLDLRFDRGITFYPASSPVPAIVDLGLSDPNTINQFTGLPVAWGTARLNEPGSDDPIALLYGIENVIGTDNADTLLGSDGDNVFEPLRGEGDILNGRGGYDTLSWLLHEGGVDATISPLNGADGLGLRWTGNVPPPPSPTAPVIAPDVADYFEKFVGSTADDRVIVGISTLPNAAGVYRIRDAAFNALIETGDGDDFVELLGGGAQDVFTGAGEDTIELRDGGHTVNAGDGNDTVILGDADDILYVDPATGEVVASTALRNSINAEGGDNNVLILDGGSYDKLEIRATTVRLEEVLEPTIPAGLSSEIVDAIEATRITSILRRFAEIRTEDGLQSIKVFNRDPTTEGDRTLLIAEDAADPVSFGIEVGEIEKAAGQTYRMTTAPEGGYAALIGPNGEPVRVVSGQTLTADELESLVFVADQAYDGETSELVYAVNGAGEFRTVNTPVPRGVALEIEAPVDPEGGPMSVTIDEVPDNGTVFILGEIASPLGYAPIPVELVVNRGDVLTPDQLTMLRFRPDQDFVGEAGRLTYTVRDDGAFDQQGRLGALVTDLRTDAEDRDGMVTNTITIRTASREDRPTSADVLFLLSPGFSFSDSLVGSDGDDDPIQFLRRVGPDIGDFALDRDGTFTYTAPTAMSFALGEDFVDAVFRYVVEETVDDRARSEDGRVTLRIVNPATWKTLRVDAANPEIEEDGSPTPLGGFGTTDSIVGYDGADFLYGFQGLDRIKGLAGDDTLLGGAQSDRIDGGTGHDELWGEEDHDVVFGREGDDTLYGGEGDDDLFGWRGDDTLYGGDGDDVIRGDFDADTAFGGAGSDRILGGAGRDVFAFRLGFDEDRLLDFNPVLEKLDFAEHDGVAGLADLTITGVGGSTIITDAFGGRIVLANVDRAQIGEGDFVFIRALTGTAVADEIIGTDGRDLIRGLGGDDALQGGDRDDTIDGGTGNDIILGGDGADTVFGGLGDDIIQGDEGDDRLGGGGGRDAYLFQQGFGEDRITDYNTFVDKLDFAEHDGVRGLGDLALGSVGGSAIVNDGEGGRIVLIGTDLATVSVSDFVFFRPGTGDAAANVLIGTSGRDALQGLGGDDTLTGRGRDDILDGGAGNDLLMGDEGDDTLLGGAGDDRLAGGEGNDVLAGGAGANTLEGGAGIDRFVFDETTGDERINDFEAGEILDFSTHALIDDYDDLLIDETAGSTIVRDGFGARIVVVNVAEADLDFTAFVF